MKLSSGYFIIFAPICALVVGYAINELTPSSFYDDARFRRTLDDISAIGAALHTYESETAFRPTAEQGLEALVVKPMLPPVPENWRQILKKLPYDPWGRDYRYRNPGLINSSGFDVYSLGADGIESVDDVGNWED